MEASLQKERWGMYPNNSGKKCALDPTLNPKQGCMRTADNHRRRGGIPPPPGPRFHSGKK